MNRLAGKVALITGTGGGMGRAAAELFAREGAVVVGCDLKEEGAQETVARVIAQCGIWTPWRRSGYRLSRLAYTATAATTPSSPEGFRSAAT